MSAVRFIGCHQTGRLVRGLLQGPAIGEDSTSSDTAIPLWRGFRAGPVPLFDLAVTDNWLERWFGVASRCHSPFVIATIV